MLNIYIAGKIRQDRSLRQVVNCSVYSTEEYLNVKPVKINDYFIYVGPFVIGCDHGCYHGPHTHGVGTNKIGCGEEGIQEETVYSQCVKQIASCDIFLAWIDEPDCYGTLVELGFASFARAFGKRVYIAFDYSSFADASDLDDFWFVRQFGQYLGLFGNISLVLDRVKEIEIGRREVELGFDIDDILDNI